MENQPEVSVRWMAETFRMKGSNTHAVSRPHNYLVYSYAALMMCLAGIVLSGYLAISHFYIHTDPAYQSFCALSKSINCDTVAQSSFSVWNGLPVAVWGVAAYCILTVLILFSTVPPGEPRGVWTIIFLASLSCSLASLWFTAVSTFIIGSWCIICIATHGINFSLVFLSWSLRRRFQNESFSAALLKDLRFFRKRIRWTGAVFCLLGAVLVSTFLWFPPYWDIEPPAPTAHYKTGLTDEGFPWSGSEKPEIEIIEFTDYQCFQCRKMHLHLLQLISRHPDKIRLIHRHFPMDHEINPIVGKPFHVGSGRMAMLAIHASIKGKFREMNDWLFFKMGTRSNTVPLAEAAAATGIDVKELAASLEHAPYRLLLKRDIHEGLSLGIVGTPSYVINGKVYEGSLPNEVLRPLLKIAGVN